MRKIIFLMFLISANYVFAKDGGSIRGKVSTAQNFVANATISLLQAKDSATVKIGFANAEGLYLFENISAGHYIISATAIGYLPAYSQAFEVAQTLVELPDIQMEPASTALSGVTVVAKRPLVEQKVDRMVVNVDASPSNVGSNALEVLEKSPGITVDKDGNISLKGKAGVMVLIDGRPTQISGSDLANLLRSMSSSELDQIEIMTNPPAKYDAAGNAGVLNIKTKKGKQNGYNGAVNLSYSQGVFPKWNGSTNFNYRKGKVNVFTNISHNHWESFQRLNIQRNFRNPSTKELLYDFDQHARMKNEFNSFNGKLGMDYFLSKKTTIGFVLNAASNSGVFTNNNVTHIVDGGDYASVTMAFAYADMRFNNKGANLNFRRVLDTAGSEVTADVDYVNYNSSNKQNLSNYYFNQAGHNIAKGDTLYGNLPQQIDIWSAKTDYVKPLKNSARLEAGLKTSFVSTNNDARYDTLHNGVLMRDYTRSNHFMYDERIHAAYGNYSRKLTQKWNMQLGLRLENTVAKGKQITTGQNFTRRYTNLFPTAYFQYASDVKNNFAINYGRRIRRPDYQSLNPFIEYIDRYTYQQGNPNLKPQFSHNIELSHTYNNFLTTTLNYTKTVDEIQQVFDQNEAKTETFVREENLAGMRQYGVAINLNKNFTKWWNSNVYVNASNNKYMGAVAGDKVAQQANMMMVNTTQQFTVSKKTATEISGWYRTGGVDGVIRFRPMGMMSVGLSQKILKGSGTLKLNVRDLFYSQQFKATAKYGNVDVRFQNRWDSRQISLGFAYRFSKGKVENIKRRTGGADDEQSRIKSGN